MLVFWCTKSIFLYEPFLKQYVCAQVPQVIQVLMEQCTYQEIKDPLVSQETQDSEGFQVGL